jgi:hypothetical protein
MENRSLFTGLGPFRGEDHASVFWQCASFLRGALLC